MSKDEKTEKTPTFAMVDVEELPVLPEKAETIEEKLRAAEATRQAMSEMEKGVFRDAVEGVLKEIPVDMGGDMVCPWCGYKSPYEKGGTQKQAIRMHMQSLHQAAVFAFHLHPELGFDAYHALVRRRAEEEELVKDAGGGLSVSDSLDTFDYLEVPAQYKERVEAFGGRLHWARPDRVEQYLQRGFQVVERKRAGFKHDHNKETAAAKANELTLMYLPPIIKERRDALKRKRVEDQNEGLFMVRDENVLEGIGRETYDRLVRQGMPSNNAMKVAKNVQDKAVSGELISSRDHWREGTQTTVETRTGPVRLN